jgi:hypothetical protein
LAPFIILKVAKASLGLFPQPFLIIQNLKNFNIEDENRKKVIPMQVLI